jgi:hypothetical protein
MSTACQSCGARLRWVVTTSGSLMPLDAEPAPDGNIAIEPLERFRMVPLAERAASTVPLFKSHFATCPNATMHRAKKK